MADIDDDEAPPALVDISQIPDAEQQEADAPSESRVPITLVTGRTLTHVLLGDCQLTVCQGYLGAGKTTLLNYILNEKHGKKIAVIMNGWFPRSVMRSSLRVL